jgi:hypothetical protein
MRGTHEADTNNLLSFPNALWDGVLAIFSKDTMELRAWSTRWIILGMYVPRSLLFGRQ